MGKAFRKKMAKIKRKKKNKIRKYAANLRKKPPKSELWFYELYKNFKEDFDSYNQQIFMFIPDVLNSRLKYIIEIDGSIHLKESQQKYDRRRDRVFESKGYKVFRLEAFDLDSFNKCMKRLVEWRERNPPVFKHYQRDPSDFEIIDGRVVLKVPKLNLSFGVTEEKVASEG